MRSAVLGHPAVRRASMMPVREDTLLSVPPALEPLFPRGGLQKGTVVGTSGLGATSTALALAAGAGRDGGWTAVVGAPWLGCGAAMAAGVPPDRLVVVPDPKAAWDAVVAAILDAFDVLILAPPPGLREAHARQVAGRVRDRGRVVLTIGRWPLRTDMTLTGTRAEWEGIGAGYGRLTARRLEISATGRGAASQTRRTEVWLPGRNGGIEPVHQAGVTPLRRRAAG